MLKIATLAVTASLAVAGVAGAQEAPTPHTGPLAPTRAACKAERASLGKDAFRAKYLKEGHKRGAGRRCVRLTVRAAVKQCRTERKADKAAFNAKYGAKGRKAVRVCVRQALGAPAPAAPAAS